MHLVIFSHSYHHTLIMQDFSTLLEQKQEELEKLKKDLEQACCSIYQAARDFVSGVGLVVNIQREVRSINQELTLWKVMKDSPLLTDVSTNVSSEANLLLDIDEFQVPPNSPLLTDVSTNVSSEANLLLDIDEFQVTPNSPVLLENLLEDLPLCSNEAVEDEFEVPDILENLPLSYLDDILNGIPERESPMELD